MMDLVMPYYVFSMSFVDFYYLSSLIFLVLKYLKRDPYSSITNSISTEMQLEFDK